MVMFLFILGFLACLLATRYLAVRKGRDPVYWTVVAVILGPLALLALLVIPSKNRT